MFGQPQDDITAWTRTPRLDEAEVTLRDLGFQRKRHLAEATTLAPDAQQITNRGRMSVHPDDRWLFLLIT